MSSTHDVVCIGFGTTALSIAVALEGRDHAQDLLFLEKLSYATWQPRLNHTGHRMRTSMLEDLVTSEDPRSKFTFINYLHATDQLVAFVNISQTRPSREIFQKYLGWCAAHFESRVQFGRKVVAIDAVWGSDGTVSGWRVSHKDFEGNVDVVFTKRVVCAVGIQAHVDPILSVPRLESLVIHSSAFHHDILHALPQTNSPLNIAIFGNGQTAAEAFYSLHDSYSDHRVTWYMGEQTPQVNDDTPFTKNIIQQPTSQDFPPELRRRAVARDSSNRPSNTVDRSVLDQIYEAQYEQSVKQQDPSKWRYQLKTQCQLLSAEKQQPAGTVKLTFQFVSSDGVQSVDSQSFNLAISATGYKRTEFSNITEPLNDLLDSNGRLQVNQDYKVNFRSGLVSKNCGIWVYGCLDSDEDVEDTKFSIIAEAARRLTGSLLATSAAFNTDIHGFSEGHHAPRL